MKNEKNIEALNTLVEINNDRIEGYETAAKETEEEELKILFANLIKTSSKCKRDLVTEIIKLGGVPIEGTKTTGKFFRVWMDVKAALSGNDRKTILNSCQYGETVAVDTYNKVLAEELTELTSDQVILLKVQLVLLRADGEEVKNLLEAIAA
jgi:uncharacterized protein (TIGR02284 family)